MPCLIYLMELLREFLSKGSCSLWLAIYTSVGHIYVIWAVLPEFRNDIYLFFFFVCLSFLRWYLSTVRDLFNINSMIFLLPPWATLTMNLYLQYKNFMYEMHAWKCIFLAGGDWGPFRENKDIQLQGKMSWILSLLS